MDGESGESGDAEPRSAAGPVEKRGSEVESIEVSFAFSTEVDIAKNTIRRNGCGYGQERDSLWNSAQSTCGRRNIAADGGQVGGCLRNCRRLSLDFATGVEDRRVIAVAEEPADLG